MTRVKRFLYLQTNFLSMLNTLRITALIAIIWVSPNFMGQTQQIIGQSDDEDLNTITTAVPFLIIAPDTRSGGMGEAGVSISPDANSIHWNPAKLAFAESDFEMSLSYSPWLRKLVRDMNLAYLSGYSKIDDNQAIGASLRFFSLGSIQFTDEQGNDIRNFEPTEFAIDGAYAIKLSERFSGGMAARFIYSNLTGGVITSSGGESKPGTAFSVDVSGYYENDDIRIGDFDAVLSAGFNISNIGSKMSYTQAAERDFIPINFRIGPTLKLLLDEYNSLAFTVDVNKLLVPTPPVYLVDEEGNFVTDGSGNLVIASGDDPNRGVASGMFGSFSDAPGNVTIFDDGTVEVEEGSVFREEMREINLATGFEYWYADQFALRGGYFYEHPTKGARQFFTLGAGVKYNVFAFDFSYLIAAQNRNPLANTLRFTLRLNLDGAKKSAAGQEG
ncbi:MAG: type IX secretion system outer membrane channel protein PorV [Flavobacteriales bacterium]|nr:type IX secretion system outer membrane channel protein PorV [Flavobacteriales bacterium]